ncbi:MAG TPA: hypothetical protein PLQ97_10045 [Myxococcota bacterium]|nr:hypothetical protein [Myxococcota bacterium]HQK51220.1 hypothetical protein [Myxococcota bacterium]
MRRLVILLAMTGWIGCGWEADGGARLQELYHPDAGAKDSGVELPTDPGREGGPPADAVPDEGDRDLGVGTDLSPGEVSTGSLEGTWVGRIVQQGEITPLFSPWPITTTDWLVGTATGGTLTWRLCTEVPVVHDEDPDNDFVTRMPDGTAQALRDRRPIRLAIEGGTLKAKSVIWTWGLVDPEDAVSPLPKTGTDPRVEDTDQDGYPGVTMEVLSPVAGRRYLVRRVRFTFPETAVSGDGLWIVGPLTYTIEEQAVGADPSALKADTPITPQDGSLFVFRRVSPVDCDVLMALGEAAFDGAPTR